jgi:uncharacterized damage-inducible protein DinB
MHASFLSKLFELNYGALFRNLEGITHEESFIEPQPGGNCLNWVLGHIVASRSRLLLIVGVPPIWPKELAFRYSGREEANWSSAEATHLDTIKTDLARSQQQLLNALDTMSDKALMTQTNDGRTLAEVVGFLHFHESYHSGQVALLRRIIGKAGVIKPAVPAGPRPPLDVRV